MFNNLVRPPPCLSGPPPPDPIRAVEEGEDEGDALLSSSIAAMDETALLPADLGTSGYDVVPEGEVKPKAKKVLGLGGRSSDA